MDDVWLNNEDVDIPIFFSYSVFDFFYINNLSLYEFNISIIHN